MIRWRDLTLAGKGTAALAAVAALVLAFALAARWWDGLTAWLPWSDESRLERTQTRLDKTEADLAARRAEVRALERQAVRVDAAHETLTEARAVTARAQTQAEEAPDADQTIDPERAGRLRHADRRLCELSPDVCPTGPDRPAGPGA